MLRALLLTLAILVPFASSAAAECAWVLWEERFTVSSRGDSKDWEIVGTALEANACNAFGTRAAADRAQRWRSVLTDVKIEGNQVTVESKAGFVSNFRYLCLPDTIDPRK